ncbi:MAG: arginine deiminase-related protein, partial [Bacteroidota bacterium]
MPIAITRSVSPRMASCELTHLDRQLINIALAEKQHEEYEDALRRLGCEILRAPDLPFHADSVFVEDCAFVVDELAIITRPGAESRRGEAVSIADTLEPHRTMYFIEAPATLDGGDILRVGRQIWVGLSSRSNAAAVEQMRHFLKPYGYTVEGIHLKDCLHL